MLDVMSVNCCTNTAQDVQYIYGLYCLNEHFICSILFVIIFTCLLFQQNEGARMTQNTNL